MLYDHTMMPVLHLFLQHCNCAGLLVAVIGCMVQARTIQRHQVVIFWVLSSFVPCTKHDNQACNEHAALAMSKTNLQRYKPHEHERHCLRKLCLSKWQFMQILATCKIMCHVRLLQQQVLYAAFRHGALHMAFGA